MSQKVSRKSMSGMNEEKEKRQSDSPAKDVKKKLPTDKEKQVADKPDKQSEKQTDKKQAEKSEKQPDKSTDKSADKKDKTAEKSDSHGERSKDDGAKEERNPKNVPHEDKVMILPQQNGNAIGRNGVADVTNGTASETNGTVSGGDSDDDDVTLVIDDEPDQDEMYPELTYDDTSDTEGFELPTSDCAPSRSLTRRSQVKATRTPETPRPASDKQTDKDSDADPKDSKVLKLKDDTPSSDRKLRSSDSPKPQDSKKSQEPMKRQDATLESNTGKESSEKAESEGKGEQDNSEQESKKQTGETKRKEESVLKVIVEEDNKNIIDASVEKSPEELVQIEVVVEVEPDVEEEKEEPRKLDTNYSKSRVKVSPYRRSSRIADQTTSSMIANYTGNNTTMEMDITETSFTSEREVSPTADDSAYLRGLRTIRARNSYKKLAHVSLTNLANRSARSLGNTSGCESRPTAPVVGRKRRPDSDRLEALDHQHQPQPSVTASKRIRLLDRIAHPFRRNLPHALSTTVAPDIVGINTDLPLTAPVASADTFDPETLKVAPLSSPVVPAEPVATPLGPHHHADNKRCSIM